MVWSEGNMSLKNPVTTPGIDPGTVRLVGFEAGLMNIPKDKPLGGQNESCSHVLIGDEAFALKSYLMRPFPYRQSRLSPRKENYNIRLCKARRVVENAVGI